MTDSKITSKSALQSTRRGVMMTLGMTLLHGFNMSIYACSDIHRA
ncbi:hypothetical protein [Bradyrhizobium sp. NAS80.1]|nr:hypothetical protein [Bradyrhizobium sp. NAS80.1]